VEICFQQKSTLQWRLKHKYCLLSTGGSDPNKKLWEQLIAYCPLIRHAWLRNRRVQQFFPCRVCIRLHVKNVLEASLIAWRMVNRYRACCYRMVSSSRSLFKHSSLPILRIVKSKCGYKLPLIQKMILSNKFNMIKNVYYNAGR
jgi:hypothetical protein